ncbi:hypothetical protein [Endozoicomonas ascidiicola]|uniref:hypothetical protein n=1 Tax=Endozoicomonas ascidiicola TaxID=1698521 RepID=UPI000835E0BA|nr:hypothetical protein [Endozoicomonas ascidiicola]
MDAVTAQPKSIISNTQADTSYNHCKKVGQFTGECCIRTCKIVAPPVIGAGIGFIIGGVFCEVPRLVGVAAGCVPAGFLAHLEIPICGAVTGGSLAGAVQIGLALRKCCNQSPKEQVIFRQPVLSRDDLIGRWERPVASIEESDNTDTASESLPEKPDNYEEHSAIVSLFEQYSAYDSQAISRL